MGSTGTVCTINASVGYAADPQGHGVAYARLCHADGRNPVLLRVPFFVQRLPALLEREVGYAALAAIVRTLHERGATRLNLAVDDAQLVADLTERRSLPITLALPYVRLRCALNQVREHHVVHRPARDLTARALAEVALHDAA